MENKALKTGVYYNKNIFCDTCEQPIDVDFTLPDYCPDISKIFKCKAVARITSKALNGRTVTVDGTVCITLLYCDKENNLCSYEYMYPFSKSKEIPEECNDASLTASARCEYINCRAVTGRKVDIHGAASIKIRVFRRCSNQIVSDYDGDNVQLKRMVAPATVPMGYSEKYLIIEDELNIGSAQPPIISIIRYDASPNVTECKVIKDKVVVKGEMTVTVLYWAEGVKIPQLCKTTLPFSQIVEMSGVNELCKCDITAELASLEIKPFAVMSAECRNFSVNAKILLKCESYCVNDIAVIEDAFSTRYATEITKSRLPFKKICENINEKCHLKKNLELSENITSVIDIWCEVGSKKVRFENSKMCLNALILVGMMVCDQDENVVFYEKGVDFEWSYPVNFNCENLSANPNIEISSVGFTILTANCIELRAELIVSGAIYEKTEIELLSDMTVDTQKPSCSHKKGGMVICYTGNKGCVWDIARKYNACIDDIMSINGLETDNFEGKKMILVPIN